LLRLLLFFCKGIRSSRLAGEPDIFQYIAQVLPLVFPKTPRDSAKTIRLFADLMCNALPMISLLWIAVSNRISCESDDFTKK
jgi:hypothetical protein